MPIWRPENKEKWSNNGSRIVLHFAPFEHFLYFSIAAHKTFPTNIPHWGIWKTPIHSCHKQFDILTFKTYVFPFTITVKPKNKIFTSTCFLLQMFADMGLQNITDTKGNLTALKYIEVIQKHRNACAYSSSICIFYKQWIELLYLSMSHAKLPTQNGYFTNSC